MTAQELITAINEKEIPSPRWLGDEFPDVEWKHIAEVDRDEHRWYIVATLVYMIDGVLIGVAGPVSLKSESMGYEDIYMGGCEAFEMEAVESVTYRRKRNKEEE